MVNEQTLCKNGRQAILALAQNVVGPEGDNAEKMNTNPNKLAGTKRKSTRSPDRIGGDRGLPPTQDGGASAGAGPLLEADREKQIEMDEIKFEQDEIVTKLEYFIKWYAYLKGQNEELKENNLTLSTKNNEYEKKIETLQSRIMDLQSKPPAVSDTYEKENTMLRQIIAQSSEFRQQILEMLQQD